MAEEPRIPDLIPVHLLGRAFALMGSSVTLTARQAVSYRHPCSAPATAAAAPLTRQPGRTSSAVAPIGWLSRRVLPRNQAPVTDCDETSRDRQRTSAKRSADVRAGPGRVILVGYSMGGLAIRRVGVSTVARDWLGD